MQLKNFLYFLTKSSSSYRVNIWARSLYTQCLYSLDKYSNMLYHKKLMKLCLSTMLQKKAKLSKFHNKNLLTNDTFFEILKGLNFFFYLIDLWMCRLTDIIKIDQMSKFITWKMCKCMKCINYFCVNFHGVYNKAFMCLAMHIVCISVNLCFFSHWNNLSTKFTVLIV